MAGSKRPPKHKGGRPRGKTKRDYRRPLRRVAALVRDGKTERAAVKIAAAESEIPFGTLRHQFEQHKERLMAPLPPDAPEAIPARPPTPQAALSDEALRAKIRAEIERAEKERERRWGLEMRARGLL